LTNSWEEKLRKTDWLIDQIVYKLYGERVMASFFQKYGDKIEFGSAKDLRIKFSEINCSVPEATKGRTTDHRERYCLKYYLEELVKKEKLTFPLKVKKEESPDFLITMDNGVKIGLEVTEGTTPEYQRKIKEFEKRFKKNGIGYEFIGPWVDGAPECKWTEIIVMRIKEKLQKLNQSHFKSANRYELLIYDNNDLTLPVRIEEALPMLRRKLCDVLKSFKKIFDSISILTPQGRKEQLLYDILKDKNC